MLNILGEDKHLLDIKNLGDSKVHLYGKSEAKVGRKMGHINFIGDTIEECFEKIKSLNESISKI